MLENLERIPWSEFGSSHIPILIRNLTLPERKARNDSFKELEHFLAPWEAFELGVYQHEALLNLVKRRSIVLSIPFLFELLEADATQDKELLLWLLEELLRYGDETVELNLNEQERSEYRIYAQQICDAVYQGIALFRILAKD